jgi:hypothetical protein
MKLSVTRRGEALAATSGGMQLEAIGSLTPGATTCTNSTSTTCASTIVAEPVEG